MYLLRYLNEKISKTFQKLMIYQQNHKCENLVNFGTNDVQVVRRHR